MRHPYSLFEFANASGQNRRCIRFMIPRGRGWPSKQSPPAWQPGHPSCWGPVLGGVPASGLRRHPRRALQDQPRDWPLQGYLRGGRVSGPGPHPSVGGTSGGGGFYPRLPLARMPPSTEGGITGRPVAPLRLNLRRRGPIVYPLCVQRFPRRRWGRHAETGPEGALGRCGCLTSSTTHKKKTVG